MLEKAKTKDLSNPPEINLTNCNSVEEIESSLSLMAQYANKSLSHAFKAQLQVVKYISKPDLIGSTFDLFFKNLKKAIQYADDEDDAYEIREKASVMLNNFVFFMKAKLEMEISVNQREGAKLLSEAANGLAESIVSLGTMYAGGVGKVALKAGAITKIGTILFNPDNINNSWLSRGIRWLFKKSRTAEKEYNFYESLDKLADKLIDQYEVIGSNDLIAGIFENHKDGLMDHHSWEWRGDFSTAQQSLDNSWQIPIWILSIGGLLGGVVWLIWWIISLFKEMTHGWAYQLWMWTGIGVGGAAFIVSIVFLCRYGIYNHKGKNKIKFYLDRYYTIINYFKE